MRSLFFDKLKYIGYCRNSKIEGRLYVSMIKYRRVGYNFIEDFLACRLVENSSIMGRCYMNRNPFK